MVTVNVCTGDGESMIVNVILCILSFFSDFEV